MPLLRHLSRGYREGVAVHQVNPAFSSVVGRVKFMERYGLSVHQAAALVLARRLLGCSERIPRRWVCPVGNGVQVAFTVPARKRVKHVWTYWGAISGQLRPALAAQHRLGKRRRRPNPVQAVVRAEARGWLERGSDRCSRVRIPGGAVLHCWGGGAAETASSGMADDRLVTKSTFFTTVAEDAYDHRMRVFGALHKNSGLNRFTVWLGPKPVGKLILLEAGVEAVADAQW